MKTLINLIITLIIISSVNINAQEDPPYAPFNTSYIQVPLTQNFSNPPGTTVDKTKLAFDLGAVNQSGYIDFVTTFSAKFVGNNQYSGNRGYWNVNAGNSNYEQPSGPFLNQNEYYTGAGDFSNDNGFIYLRSLSMDRKDLAVVKDNGLYVYRNDNNEISSSNYQYVSGGMGT